MLESAKILIFISTIGVIGVLFLITFQAPSKHVRGINPAVSMQELESYCNKRNQIAGCVAIPWGERLHDRPREVHCMCELP